MTNNKNAKKQRKDFIAACTWEHDCDEECTFNTPDGVVLGEVYPTYEGQFCVRVKTGYNWITDNLKTLAASKKYIVDNVYSEYLDEAAFADKFLI